MEEITTRFVGLLRHANEYKKANIGNNLRF